MSACIGLSDMCWKSTYFGSVYRIYALYHHELWTVAAVSVLLLVEIGTYSWLLTTGTRECYLQSIYKDIIDSGFFSRNAYFWLNM